MTFVILKNLLKLNKIYARYSEEYPFYRNASENVSVREDKFFYSISPFINPWQSSEPALAEFETLAGLCQTLAGFKMRRHLNHKSIMPYSYYYPAW